MYNDNIPKTVNILSVINTDGIMGQNHPSDAITQNIFMINDSNKFQQFGNTLKFYCKKGDVLRFRFCGVKRESDVQLVGFRRKPGCFPLFSKIRYNNTDNCWEAKVRYNGESTYYWVLRANNKLFVWDLSINLARPISVLGVVDCANAADDYKHFRQYVYLMDSKNNAGMPQSVKDGKIEPMIIYCSYGDILCFSLRGILPSDMPVIRELECEECIFEANPVNYPVGTWLAYVVGDSDSTLKYTVEMPDGTEHTFKIGLNITDIN